MQNYQLVLLSLPASVSSWCPSSVTIVLVDMALAVFSNARDFTMMTSSVSFKLIRNLSVSAVEDQQQTLINFELI